MDAPTSRPDHAEDEAAVLAEHITIKRDRLLASLTLIAGIGLVFAIPFALRAGAEFFLPVTAALVIAIALVPMLEWFERRGLPSALSALSCVILFLGVMAFALLSIVIPAIDWVALLPERIGRVREALEPILALVKDLERFVDRILNQLPSASTGGARTVQVETPNSMFDLLTSSAPHALIQLFFALLVIYFFLSGWTAMRKQTITSRGSFEGALTTARVIQQVVAATSTYLGTITLINVTLGALVAGILWWMGMDSPLMWGGIVAVLNYIPYLGPIAAALLLALGGLISFSDPWTALLPPLIFVGMHMVEANAITPLVVGKRVRINPLLILLSLSFWAWVWGTTGALLAIPLLIILKTVFAAAGTPDIAGFLFEQGTLTHAGEEEEEHSATAQGA
ncbi:putative PurR-regulated permease PerM [Sphingomonas kaistensis]|uniref:Putative PurR-regulated permease PerM n=1 Tax=Sphingomonas kaistensis TaxID=298708 RepID=A0A7X6BGU1_9SPHN|nr:AI-2E family transporter [Sphingomonas kaistensis]NJC06804.1 putative PurR-regulated permease PerM [Sphingomonas kaistensis]